MLEHERITESPCGCRQDVSGFHTYFCPRHAAEIEAGLEHRDPRGLYEAEEADNA